MGILNIWAAMRIFEHVLGYMAAVGLPGQLWKYLVTYGQTCVALGTHGQLW